MPWAMLWNLNMKKKEKFGVAIAMSLGVLYASRCTSYTPSLTVAAPDPSPSSNAPNSKPTRQVPTLPTTSANSSYGPVPRTPSSSRLLAFPVFDLCCEPSSRRRSSRAKTRTLSKTSRTTSCSSRSTRPANGVLSLRLRPIRTTLPITRAIGVFSRNIEVLWRVSIGAARGMGLVVLIAIMESMSKRHWMWTFRMTRTRCHSSKRRVSG